MRSHVMEPPDLRASILRPCSTRCASSGVRPVVDIVVLGRKLFFHKRATHLVVFSPHAVRRVRLAGHLILHISPNAGGFRSTDHTSSPRQVTLPPLYHSYITFSLPPSLPPSLKTAAATHASQRLLLSIKARAKTSTRRFKLTTYVFSPSELDAIFSRQTLTLCTRVL